MHAIGLIWFYVFLVTIILLLLFYSPTREANSILLKLSPLSSCCSYAKQDLRNNFFLTGELWLISTCCWRADHEILIHDGASRSELIFESAQQHVLISNNSPINTCCWRANPEILIHDSASRGELIFESARQHMLISDNSPVRKKYFDSNII